MDTGISGIVLAAGFSSRMGMFKPLLPLGSSTAVERTVMSLREGGVRDIVVITGHRAEELRPLVASLGVREVTNSQPELGMLSSILIGVSALADTATAVFVLPADMPMIRPSTVRLLGDVFTSSEATVVRPSFRGRRGHPPLVSRACFDGPLSPLTPGGLGAIIARQTIVVDTPVLDEGILWDMDTPEEYARMAAQADHESIPTEAECEAILEHFAVPSAVIAHSRVVAAVAGRLAVSVNRVDGTLNIPLVRAAGMLHDVAQGQRARDRDGASLLRELGFDGLASIVSQCSDLYHELRLQEPLREEHLLCLADELVQGEMIRSLEEQFQNAAQAHDDAPEALAAIKRRFQSALAVSGRVQALTGLPVARIIDSVNE